ncbi:MAG: hypothetical protein IT252_06860 [Chitinophagaceae bacterium]|nr:hypothetical protein [Chitinophagaceae bacterium]
MPKIDPDMRLRFLTLVLVMLAGHAMAQQTKSLQKVMQLKMQGDGGSNGAAIAFHTVNKKYYAAMAGNTTYPLCVFNEQGYLVSGGQVESLADVRGLWFNTRKAKLQGNAYGENGWFEYTLDGNGIPTDHRIIMENASQPDPQSVGTFAAKLNQVLFFDGRDIYFYDVISGEVKESLSLEEMRKKSGMGSFDADDYNNSTVFYTGITGQEIGVVNTATRMVELYGMSGQLGQKLAIPSGVSLYTKFNCGYANGMYWFFDQSTRTWTGYKEGSATTGGTTTQPVTTGTLGGGTGSSNSKYTKIVTVGDLYSTYDLAGSNADDVSRWRSEWGSSTVDKILELSKESGWPENINTLSKRDGKRERFTQYMAYYIADVGSDKVLLWLPKAENQNVDSDLRLPFDIYMVYKKSAVTLGQKTRPPSSAATGTKTLGGGTGSGSGSRATVIKDPGQLYSTYDLEKDESGIASLLRNTYGTAAGNEILKRAVETGWPSGISTFTGRNSYREGFINFVAYYIADIGTDKVLLWIPMNKNGHMPAACRGDNDIYMVYARSAVTLGDKVKATVNIKQETNNGGGGDDGRTKPVTGVLGGGSGTKPQPATQAATGNFQAQFESILKAYGNNFSGIKGTERSASGAIFKDWNTSVKLAGSFDCYLTEGILNDHLEYVADYGIIKNKNAAMIKMNALIANVLKVGGTYALKRDNVETKEKSIVELFVLKGTAAKEYEYLLVEIGMYKKGDTNDEWSVQILVYSEEEDW